MNDLLTSRNHLSQLLKHLAHAPELLLRPHVVERLECTIASYQNHYELMSGEFLTPSSPPKRLTRSHPDSVHEELDHEPDSQEQSARLKEDIETQGEHIPSQHSPQDEPPKHASLTACTPVEQGLSAGTLVLVNRVPELFEVLDHGLEGRHLIEKVERLKAWSLRDEYLELDVARQRELAHYLVARLRGVQDGLPHHDAQTYKSRFRDIAVGIMEMFKSDEHDVGFIYGLNQSHEPGHGARWEDDACHWRDALLTHITPPDYDEHPSTSTRTTSSSSSPSPLPESLEPYVSALEHKRVLCVGGKRKPHQIKNLNTWFPTTSFEWVESEKGKGMRHAQRESERIKAGRYDVVWMFARALSHSETDLLIEACKQSSHRVHRVCIEKGFGPGDLRDGLDRSSPPLLNSETEEE